MPTPVAIAYVAALCGVLPFLAWVSKRKIDEGFRAPRMALYAEALLLQVFLLAISLLVARSAALPLFGGRAPRLADLLIGLATLALALVAVSIGWKVAGEKSADRLRFLVPSTPRERIAWTAVSSAAGISEEVAFRGVLPVALYALTGTLWVSIVISAAAFAMAHLLQGWWAALFVGVFGLIFHGVVWITGGLAVAIAVHIAYDVIVGLTIGKVLAAPPEVADAEV